MGPTCNCHHRRHQYHQHQQQSRSIECHRSRISDDCIGRIVLSTDRWQWCTECCHSRQQRHDPFNIFQLLWQFGGQHQWRYHAIPTNITIIVDIRKQWQRFRLFTSIICSAFKEIIRTAVDNVEPSIRPSVHVRWSSNELCASTTTTDRRSRPASDCMSYLAMGRFKLYQRIETKPIVCQCRRSCLCLLQSNSLVPPFSYRYDFHMEYRISDSYTSGHIIF